MLGLRVLVMVQLVEIANRKTPVKTSYKEKPSGSQGETMVKTHVWKPPRDKHGEEFLWTPSASNHSPTPVMKTN